MKLFSPLALFALFFLQSSAQVSFSALPLNKQVVPRNVFTNKGKIEIAGTVNDIGTPYNKIRIKKYRNNIFQQDYNHTLTYQNDIAPFSFSISITAELANYKTEIYGVIGLSETLIQTVDSLVAGDAFIIQGQSNAVADMYSGSSNQQNKNSFIRVYGSGTEGTCNKAWYIADGDASQDDNGNAGQWGLRLAKRLLNNYQIPYAIFNGANGGRPVSWFLRDNATPNNPNTNYGRLLQRITETGFKDKIPAIFWYQGEADSYSGNSVDGYKQTFMQLQSGWQTDYSMYSSLFIIQIKQGCGADAEGVNIIQEAHRQLSADISGTAILATNGLKHASELCHYGYDSGYKMIGDYLNPLVKRNVYKEANSPNIEPPFVSEIVQTGPKKVSLHFKNFNDTYLWEAGTENDFVVDGSSAKVISGSVNGSHILLTLDINSPNIQTLSFRGHTVNGSPCIRNSSGEGMVGFYKFPVSQGTPNPLSSSITSSQINILSVYPNPAKDFLSLQYQVLKSSQITISIFNNNGINVYEFNAGSHTASATKTQLNISSLPKGIYVVKLRMGETTLLQKFIKE